MVTSNFWLFPKMKSALRDKDFGILMTYKKSVMAALTAVPQQESQKCFQQWQHRGAKFIAAQGEYFKGNSCQ
jgi:hypothetical protein